MILTVILRIGIFSAAWEPAKHWGLWGGGGEKRDHELHTFSSFSLPDFGLKISVKISLALSNKSTSYNVQYGEIDIC